MAAIERTSGVDLVATGSPSTGGGRGREREPCSPKDLASAYDAAGLHVLCSCPDGSVDFHSEPLLDRGLARDRATAVSASAAQMPNGVVSGSERFKREMMDLEELLSRLNPTAEELVSPSLSGQGNGCGAAGGGDGRVLCQWFWGEQPSAESWDACKKKNGYGDGKQRRINSRTSLAQRDEVIRRTVHVSDIDHQSGY